jgi:cytochrome c-type biogenesis protein CcmH
MEKDLTALRRQMVQLEELHAAGVLSAAAFEEGKAELERKVLERVMQGAGTAEPEAIASATAPAASQPATPTPAKISRPLLTVLGLGVVAIAAAGYTLMGSPDAWTVGPDTATGGASAGSSAAGKAAPHATSQQQIAAMVDKLATRLETDSQDAEGWAMLGRSYTMLGRHPAAMAAYQKAVNLRKDDGQLLADYADSLAMNNERRLSGEPMKWVTAALQADPRNLKALSLAGTHAFDQKDYAAAVKYWEQVQQWAQPESSYTQQVQGGLDEARQLGGLPPASAPAALKLGAGVMADAKSAPSAANDSSVSGTVSLLPALANKTRPDDTVFIYARAAEGGMRMPLAIQRRQVKDLPITFTLDDSSAMSPATRISGVNSVVVSARISRSGQATPQPGDLAGQSGTVAVGTSGIKVELRDEVR